MSLPYVLKLSLLLVLLLCGSKASAQTASHPYKTMDVGVARIDITPEEPIRLTGFASRENTESEGVIHRLYAKALAFGSDTQNPSVLITVDLVGIPGHITTDLVKRLSEKIGLEASQLVILASHTHGGPEVGNLLNILQYRDGSFSDSLLALDQMVEIAGYIDQLSQKLEQVTMKALENRSPALVAWGQGQAGFAINRRTAGGPVDPSLPLLRVTDPKGDLIAVLVNYACHGTTLGGEVNKVHGDWMSEAQRLIEEKHPGAVAMVAIGCGADANPSPRGKVEHMTLHGQEIAQNVEKLLTAQLQPLLSPPLGKIKWISLPFANVPTIEDLIEYTKDPSVKGYYARRALERFARGHAIPEELRYPVQVWSFGDEMAMVNLAGEVVVDYSTRLKHKFGAERLWVNAYANDVPCYIASKRVILEGGYEAESSMYYYDKPSPFSEEIEDLIVSAVGELMPSSFKAERDSVNSLQVVKPDQEGTLTLHAAIAQARGPAIEYMPEWKAFGWFTAEDQVSWEAEVNQAGKYEVYLEWSVSDEEAGKPYLLKVGNVQLKGKVQQSGSWFTFRTEKIGTIKLKKGRQKVTFMPASNFNKGALLDLREIKLIPVRM